MFFKILENFKIPVNFKTFEKPFFNFVFQTLLQYKNACKFREKQAKCHRIQKQKSGL